MKKIFLPVFVFFCFATFGQRKSPVPVIFDTDIAPDYDDVGAMALLHAFADRGEARILATISCNAFETTAPTLSVLNTYFKRPDIPIGITKTERPNEACKQGWAQAIVQKYPHEVRANSEAPDAVKLYRRILAAQPDKSVTIVTVGFFTNLAHLLISLPDEFSSLGGNKLVAKKVKQLVSMATRLDKDSSGGYEFNITVDAASSKKVFEEWPTPITLSGFGIGIEILTGRRLIHNQSIQNSPVKDAFRIALEKDSNTVGRYSWDETAVLVAVRGTDPYFSTRKLNFAIDADGRNVKVPGEKFKYLVFKQKPEAIGRVIEDLMMHQPNSNGHPNTFSMSRRKLKDKIMGGWAGQTIGVTFGGPYEFRFQGTFIGDYQPLLWYDGYLKKTMIENPGLYDDLYMDLTFVDVFEKYGLDAPVDSFANSFAHAGYMLWHANQAARYNLLNGIKAPQSGYWLNNPHADCIDYQIESDFAGLMSPGMPNTASSISNRIGHIMNYGDGWYGGVFVGALYSMAFLSQDIPWIISRALKTIPEQSEFYQCIHDVIGWHEKYPSDWKQTWLEVQKKWADDIGCPDGVFAPFNIDAKVNAAYVVMGLLYGGGDFTKTLEIATRCGQDADCNPSTAGGVLGAILGYEKIPAYWKMGLHDAETIDFKYTSMSLQKVYEIGFKHALQNIERQGGNVEADTVRIAVQSPQSVPFEKSFADHYPLAKIPVKWSEAKDEISFDFEGTGFVLIGDASQGDSQSDYVFNTELYIDGVLTESPRLPVSYTTRRYELCWKYQLLKAKHQIRLKILNPSKEYVIKSSEALIYSDKTLNGIEANSKASKTKSSALPPN